MGWNRSSWVFWEFFRSNHLFNQPYLRRTVGHNHILLFFLPWWDPRSTDSGPCYAILFPFYKCDGPPLPLSTSPTTTLQTNPWFHGKTPQIEGYMDPGVTLCLMEFTGNSKLEWLYFQSFLCDTFTFITTPLSADVARYFTHDEWLISFESLKILLLNLLKPFQLKFKFLNKIFVKHNA